MHWNYPRTDHNQQEFLKFTFSNWVLQSDGEESQIISTTSNVQPSFSDLVTSSWYTAAIAQPVSWTSICCSVITEPTWKGLLHEIRQSYCHKLSIRLSFSHSPHSEHACQNLMWYSIFNSFTNSCEGSAVQCALLCRMKLPAFLSEGLSGMILLFQALLELLTRNCGVIVHIKWQSEKLTCRDAKKCRQRLATISSNPQAHDAKECIEKIYLIIADMEIVWNPSPT